MNNQYDLLHEGSYLFRHLFKASPNAQLLTRYRKANLTLGLHKTDEVALNQAIMIDGNFDAVAIEYALRMRQRDNPLSRKMAILDYLAEVDCDHNSSFHQVKKGGLPMALAALFGVMVSTIYYLLKGRYLVWKYRLA